MLQARVRHVWVHMPFRHQEFPGFVLDWRRIDGNLRALVTYVDDDGRAHMEWLAEHQLRPVPSEPQTGL